MSKRKSSKRRHPDHRPARKNKALIPESKGSGFKDITGSLLKKLGVCLLVEVIKQLVILSFNWLMHS
jgi:hypothetical protein